VSGQGWYDADGVFHEGPPPGVPKADANADLAAMQRQMEELQRQIQAAQQPAPTPEPQQPASPEQQLAEMQRQMAEMQAQLRQQTGPVEPLPAAAPAAPAAAPAEPGAPAAPVAQPAPAVAPVVAAPAVAQQPQPAPAVAQPAPVVAQPAAAAPAAPVKGTGGLKALLAVLIVLLALTLAAIGWVAFSGFSLANGLPVAEESAEEEAAAAVTETVDVALAPAAAVGANAFTATQWASPADPAVAQEATGTAPGGDAQAVAAVDGSDAGLYAVPWGTSHSTGEAPSLFAELSAEPARAEAFVQALNSDPDLGWSGALTAADLEAYLKQLSQVALAEDTWVTHHAYSGGSATATQAVLQKGSVVLIDRYGVPRVRAVSGDPLTAPEAGEGVGIVASAGKAWPDFDPSDVVAVSPAASVLNSFQLAAAGATVEVSALPCRSAGLGAACDPPSATATIVKTPDAPANIVIPTVTECAPALADGAPAVDFRYVNASGKTLYMFYVEPGSCTVSQPMSGGDPNGYSGGWGVYRSPLSEGTVFVVSDGASTTPLATLTAKNGYHIVD
jgi:hypothetical protein